jgi:hypothetical protein
MSWQRDFTRRWDLGHIWQLPIWKYKDVSYEDDGMGFIGFGNGHGIVDSGSWDIYDTELDCF